MNPLVVLSVLVASAVAAPGNYGAGAGLVGAGLGRGVGLAGVAGVGVVGAPAVAVAAAPAIAVPGPRTTSRISGPDAVAVSRPAPVVSKQLHYGSQTYVAGYDTEVLKPPTPHLPISVPTVLRGTTRVNAPIVRTVKEPHVVNEPYAVPRNVPVPYDVPVVRTQVNEVPVPVAVPRAVPVATPVAVPGEPIVNVRQTAPIVQRTHTAVAAAPVAVGVAGVRGAGIAGAGLVGAGVRGAGLVGGIAHGAGIVGAGYAGAGYAGAGYAGAGYAGAGYGH